MPTHLEIPYGSGFQDLVIPDKIEFIETGKEDYEDYQFVDVTANLNCENTDEYFAGVKTLLIIINDHTRFTPSGLILAGLKEYLDKIDRIEVLIATGTHRAPTEDELKKLLGSTYSKYKGVTRAHDCLDDSQHYLAGKLSSGIDVYLDNSVDIFDNILVIGSVEPHFFAGYTGGRKGIFPGVALKQSIIDNHVKAIDRDVQPMELDNPIHRDMDEVINLLPGKNIFSIQTVHNPDRSIAGLFCGEIHRSFSEAVELAERIYVRDVDKLYDIVIAVVSSPLDIDLYQIQKSFENTKFGVKPGGVIILVSECRDGVGPDDWLRLSSRYNSSTEVLENAQDARMFGFHKLYRPARFMENSRIFVVSGVENYFVKSVFLTPKQDLQSAFNDAIKILPPNPSLLIVYDAAQNVIRLSS
ncbi:MAG: nickel-dependent lactate racemase [candidate division Zixibacteria bacterium]|nr:nickel-dependent lactate racemase [candidate division Zixibacteria bacterium]